MNMETLDGIQFVTRLPTFGPCPVFFGPLPMLLLIIFKMRVIFLTAGIGGADSPTD